MASGRMNEIPIVKIARRLRDLDPSIRWQSPRVMPTMGDGSWYIDEDVPAEFRRMIFTYGPTAEWIMQSEQDDWPPDAQMWLHASISRPHEIPTYDDLARMHQAVWPDGWSYQVFAPASEHVNIHPFALHLWGRLDGRAELPNFGALGTI